MKNAVDLLEIRFEKNSSIVTRKVAGETILVPITRSIGNEPCLYTLDDTATFIWDRLDGQTTGRDLISAVMCSYEVSSEQAEGDVRTFLEQLQSVSAIQHRHCEELEATKQSKNQRLPRPPEILAGSQ